MTYRSFTDANGVEWISLTHVARLLCRTPHTVKMRAMAGEFDLLVTGSGRYFISRPSAMNHIAEMQERTQHHG